MSVLEQIDLARQTKRDLEAFALPYGAGGTGRIDGHGAGIVHICAAKLGVAQYQAVKLVYQSGGSGNTITVDVMTATTDIPFGVALRAPTYDFELVPVMLAGVTQALATGPITEGSRAYPAASGRLVSTQPPNAEGWSIGRVLTGIGAGNGVIQLLVESVADRQPFLPATIEIILGALGVPLTTGYKGDIEVPFTCVIQAVRLVANPSASSLIIDIWKDTYANFPPTVADTITASAKPTLSAATKYQDSTLTGWNKNLTAGDWLRFNVDTATLVEQATLSLTVLRTVS